ncbi:MAG: tetratricopeptide repeat protein [Methanobacteriota archaeon]|nr:MAG: tetratricopeptide repeat protein [Euryarchaeota archaeon]
MNKIAFGALAVLMLGILLISGCRPPEVEGTVINIQKSLYDEALVSAQSAVEKYPDNAEAWFYWGWLYGDYKKDYEKMNEGFEKALKLNPAQKVTFMGQSVTLKTAIEQYRNSKFADNYNSAIKIIPQAQQTEDPEKKQKLFESALKKLQLAMRIHPARTEPYRPLALSYLALGDTAAALETVEKGLERTPNDETLLIGSGEIYMMTKSYDKAAEAFQKALEINPNNALVYQKLGNLEAARDDWTKANEYYTKAMEMEPDNADLAYNIGVGLYKQEQYTEAIPYFRKALEANPDDLLTTRILGICYVQAEKNEEGLEFLKEAVQRFPDEASLYEYMAILYGRLGKTKEAEEAFNRSKELKEMEGSK